MEMSFSFSSCRHHLACVCLSALFFSRPIKPHPAARSGAARQGILFPSFSKPRSWPPQEELTLHTHTLVPPPGSFVLGIYRVCSSWERAKKRRERGEGEGGAQLSHVPWGDHARVEDVTPKHRTSHTHDNGSDGHGLGLQRSAYFWGGSGSKLRLWGGKSVPRTASPVEGLGA